VRVAWISDVHLGVRGANAGALLDFLREYEFETLYVVGDLIDVTFLSSGCNNSFLISIAFAKSESSESRKPSPQRRTNAH
jgi:UDP-2,3-diacylglucosamine pyrophosphatase LpxH